MSLFLDFAKKIEKLRAEVDMPKELAEQYQEMVELVRNNKIENFSLQMDRVDRVAVNAHSYASIRVNFEIPNKAFPLGLPATTGHQTGKKSDIKSLLGKSASNFDKETLAVFAKVDQSLSLLNSLVGDMLPPENATYYVSKVRMNNEAGFTDPKIQKEWPMYPKFLEGLVDVSSKNETKLKM